MATQDIHNVSFTMNFSKDRVLVVKKKKKHWIFTLFKRSWKRHLCNKVDTTHYSNACSPPCTKSTQHEDDYITGTKKTMTDCRSIPRQDYWDQQQKQQQQLVPERQVPLKLDLPIPVRRTLKTSVTQTTYPTICYH